MASKKKTAKRATNPSTVAKAKRAYHRKAKAQPGAISRWLLVFQTGRELGRIEGRAEK